MPTRSQQWTTGGPVNLDSGLVQFDFKPSIGIMTKDLDTFGRRIKSFREPLKRAARYLGTSFQENFEAGGRPDPWEPLSPVTIMLRKEIWGLEGGDILIKTGALRKVVGQLSIWTIKEQSASIQDLPNSVWYGRIHQAGYSRSHYFKKGMNSAEHLYAIQQAQIKSMQTGVPLESDRVHIPARPFILIQDEDEIAVGAIFEEWISERIAAWAAKGIVV